MTSAMSAIGTKRTSNRRRQCSLSAVNRLRLCLNATAKVCISLPGRRDLCSEYKFWAMRQAISSVPKSARRNQRTTTEPTVLSAWACRQPDNKRSTIAHAHLKASRTPLPVRRERGRVSQPLTPRLKSVMPHTSHRG
jgi:hypothetical protein